MLKAFFNPYVDAIQNLESCKARLLATAKTYKALHSLEELRSHDPPGGDSVKCVHITTDSTGAKYSIGNLIGKYTSPDKELVQWFCRQLDRGTPISPEAFDICEDWTLSDLEALVPVLEYAFREDGIAVTISDNHLWRVNNLRFRDSSNNLCTHAFLPNIHGQDDLEHFVIWITKWQLRNYTFQTFLERKFQAKFCPGSANSCFPSKQEQEGLLEAFTRAKDSSYNISAGVIRTFSSKYGSMLELRSFNDGVRMFFVMTDNKPVIGGFYRKSDAINQSKSGEQAAKRLKDYGYL